MTNARDVFINCPFDDEFSDGFRALVFAVLACGFRARCAREIADAAETRIEKLYRIIDQSRFGIHDLSRTELDADSGLPRFNMPFELGIFLGARRFGGDGQDKKRCIIFDVEEYRYQKFISDLAGMDITAHANDPRSMVRCVRDWLVGVSRRKTVPNPAVLVDSYDRFFAGFADICEIAGLMPATAAYPDYERLVLAWIAEENRA